MRVAVIIVVSLLLSALFLGCFGKDRTALAMLRIGDHMLQPAAMDESPQGKPTESLRSGARPYLSPLTKKRVAAMQGWRCKVCKKLLDETFEIDHITPLHRARTDEETKKLNQIDNLQALCRRDHMAKSAMQARA